MKRRRGAASWWGGLRGSVARRACVAIGLQLLLHALAPSGVALAAGGTAAASAGAPSSPPPSAPAVVRVGVSARAGVELTSGHFGRAHSSAASLPLTMLRETREIDLPAGRSEVEWVDVPDTMRGETVQLAVEAEGATLVSQRFEEPTPGQAGFEAALVGQRVVARSRFPSDRDDWARVRDGLVPGGTVRAAKPTWSGALVSLKGGVVLRIGKELSVLPPVSLTVADASAEAAKGSPPRKIVAVVTTPGAMRVKLSVTGIVERVAARSPSYRLLLEPATHTARLTGSVLVTNETDQSMEGARLAYGSVSIEPPRGYEQARGLSATWLAHEVTPRVPFALPSSLHFAANGTADAPLVDAAALPVTESRRVTFDNLDQLREKPEGSIRTEIRHVWLLDGQSLHAGPLPNGDAFVAEASATTAPAVVARAALWQGLVSGPISVEARMTGSFVESRLLSANARGACAATVTWEHTLPVAALSAGPVELEFPFERARFEVAVGNGARGARGAEPRVGDGVTLEVLSPKGGSKLVVSPFPAGDPRRALPRKVVATYRTNRCK